MTILSKPAQIIPWIGALLLSGALACSGGDDAPTTPSTPEATPPAPESPKTETLTPEPDPAPRTEPTAGDEERGATLYATYCVSCHGPRGAGDGPLGAALDPKPAKHSDGAYMNALDDDYLFRVIQKGGAAVGKSPLMAPWGGSVNDTQIRDLIAFIRSLATPPYEP